MQSQRPTDSQQDVITLDIGRSRIVTISAKITQPELVALDLIAKKCNASRSSIVRAAIIAFVRSFCDGPGGNVLSEQEIDHIKRLLSSNDLSIAFKCTGK